MVLDAPEPNDDGHASPPTCAATSRVRARDRDARRARRCSKDVSFEAQAGTRTAVIGPTAAGKTQLLYLLTGLLEPTSGTRASTTAGRSTTTTRSALHRQIGFVFQDSDRCST